MAFKLEAIDSIAARLAITDLNTDFCHHLDHDNIESLIALFTNDAHYSHGNRVTVGLAQIKGLFDRRSAAGVRTARHLYSGLRIELTEKNKAKGQSVCMTFAADQAPPIMSASPYLIADFIDEYQCGGDGRWRISSRHIERIFMDPSNQGPVGQERSS